MSVHSLRNCSDAPTLASTVNAGLPALLATPRPVGRRRRIRLDQSEPCRPRALWARGPSSCAACRSRTASTRAPDSVDRQGRRNRRSRQRRATGMPGRGGPDRRTEGLERDGRPSSPARACAAASTTLAGATRREHLRRSRRARQHKHRTTTAGKWSTRPFLGGGFDRRATIERDGSRPRTPASDAKRFSLSKGARKRCNAKKLSRYPRRHNQSRLLRSWLLRQIKGSGRMTLGRTVDGLSSLDKPRATRPPTPRSPSPRR